MEDELLDHQPKNFYETVIVSRKELLALHTYYEQLISLGEELESNDNHLFSEGECTGFGMFASRASRLHDHGDAAGVCVSDSGDVSVPDCLKPEPDYELADGGDHDLFTAQPVGGLVQDEFYQYA